MDLKEAKEIAKWCAKTFNEWQCIVDICFRGDWAVFSEKQVEDDLHGYNLREKVFFYASPMGGRIERIDQDMRDTQRRLRLEGKDITWRKSIHTFKIEGRK